MAHADNLLSLANGILPKAAGRPNQAQIRRSVSTSYYAVFHRLIERAVDQIAGVTAKVALRSLISRSFEHGAMKRASQGIASGNPPPILRNLIAPPIPADLQALAKAFVELQQRRHAADYDLAVRFSKPEAVWCHLLAVHAFKLLDGPLSPEMKHFLILLPMWSQLERR